MSDIRPVDLPTAAGVEFGRGDVRHFSEDDAVGVVGLQTPTRHLAQRDNILASKLNEVVAAVNNKEQFVPLSIPRTSVAPGVEEIVTNFAIPAGFEARVLNATVGSNPVSTNAGLRIYFSNGYGNATGVELVSTTSTFQSGVAFYNDGEFVIALRNNGASTLEIVSSITLTIRPIGSTASLLVGSIIQGQRGYPGRQGDPGLKGDPGVGGAGTAGLVWKGTFNSANSYNVNDAVNYTSGGVTQSYICILNNPSVSVAPPSATYWDVLSSSGSAGAPGAGLNWLGPWSLVLTYSVNDAVSYTNGGVTSSYICKLAVTIPGTPPPSDPTHWDVFAGPGGGETPSYSVTDVSSLLSYQAWPPGTPIDGYNGYGQSSVVAPLPALSIVEQAIFNSSGSPRGLVFLQFAKQLHLANTPGTITFTLFTSPTATAWTTANTQLTVSTHGTALVTGAGTEAHLVTVSTPSNNQYTIKNWTNQDVQIGISLTGVQPVL